MDHREHPAHDGPPPHGPGYETSDAPPRPIVITGVLIVVVTALVALLLRGMVSGLEREEPVLPVVKEEAKLEDNPFTNLYAQKDRLRKEESDALGGYAYDKKTGVAVIPIDRAMDLIAERGVPKGKGPKSEVDVIRRGEEAGKK
jgi:hypothetical protein